MLTWKPPTSPAEEGAARPSATSLRGGVDRRAVVTQWRKKLTAGYLAELWLLPATPSTRSERNRDRSPSNVVLPREGGRYGDASGKYLGPLPNQGNRRRIPLVLRDILVAVATGNRLNRATIGPTSRGGPARIRHRRGLATAVRHGSRIRWIGRFPVNWLALGRRPRTHVHRSTTATRALGKHSPGERPLRTRRLPARISRSSSV